MRTDKDTIKIKLKPKLSNLKFPPGFLGENVNENP